MPEFLSPGVFIEEVDAGPKPIEGVSTSTAGAVGVTTFGPTEGKPVLVTSFAEFTRIFGPPMPEPTGGLFNKWIDKEGGRWWEFALSIKGFFDNGGQRIFVKRVFSKKSAKAADFAFGQGLLSEIEADAPAGATSLKLRHLIGISRFTPITVLDPGFVGTFRVVSYDPVTRTIRLDGALAKALQAGKSFVQILLPRTSDPTFTVRAKALGRWGNDLRAQVRPMVGATTSLLVDPATLIPAFKTSVVSSKLTWVIKVDDLTGLDQAPQEVVIKGTRYDILRDSFGNYTDPDTGTFEVQGTPPTDVMTADEAQGKVPLLIRTRNGFSAHLTAEVPARGNTLELADIGSTPSLGSILGEGDVIQVGLSGEFGEHKIVKVTPSPISSPLSSPLAGRPGSVQVDPPFSDIVPLATPIKKVTTKVVNAGTIRNMTLTDSTNLAVNEHFIFVPTGKQFKVTKVSGGTIQFAPAIPLGFDWVSRQIEYSSPKIQTTVSGNTADWDLMVDSTAGLQPGNHVLIKGEEIVTGEISIPDKKLFLAVLHDSGDPWPKATPVSLLRPAANPKGSVVHASGASQLYKGAIVELDNGAQKDVATIESINGDKVTLSKPLANGYLEGHKLRVVEAEIQARQVVKNQTVQQESFTNLRLIDDKTSSYFVTGVRNGSSLIEIADPLGPGFPDTPAKLADLARFPTSADGGFAPLTKGDDGLDDLTVDDFVGEDGGSSRRTGIQALEDIDEISICLAPDVWAPTVHSALILHCETLKDRFAILDPRDGLSIQQIRDVRENLDSKYAALYYPWIEVRDPFAGQNVQVAPSGHVAGIYARVDVERGVHKAPANEIIRGINKIADDVNTREQDLLNPKGINVLRFFPGRGNRVWGARTISSDSSWKYVNVRRLFIMVEESIDEGTQFVVFEPNSEPTWARVRQTITNFLTTVWRGGALEGTTADQAFFVKCDRTTMSQDDIDNGRLICVIGIAPVKPAEFVIFQIQQLVRSNTP